MAVIILQFKVTLWLVPSLFMTNSILEDQGGSREVCLSEFVGFSLWQEMYFFHLSLNIRFLFLHDRSRSFPDVVGLKGVWRRGESFLNDKQSQTGWFCTDRKKER